MADFHNAGAGNGVGAQGYVSGQGQAGAAQTYGGYGFQGYTQPGVTSYDSWVEPEEADPEQIEPEQGPAGPGGPAQWGKAVNMLGAVASLALIVGVGIWGYKLVVRDVSGVPVVRAIEGPMRVQPTDPGGKPADHQGLAVNAVAAQGTAAAPADRLVLAPKPVSLSEEDQPVIAETVASAAASPETQPEVEATPVTAPLSTDEQVDALVAELTQGVPSLLETDEETVAIAIETAAVAAIVQPEPLKPTVTAAVAPTPQAAVVTGPGLARSLRPVQRPARTVAQAQAVQAALNTAADASANLDVDPTTLPAGTRLAQLGAYESVEIARSEWDRLNGRFSDYLDGKKRVIQKASSGGRTFYRLRAMGFDDLSDARRFCSALVAGNADCIPVTTR